MERITHLQQIESFTGQVIDLEKDKEMLFLDIIKNLVVRKNNKYIYSIFYYKNDICYMELYKNSSLYCSHTVIWSVFEREYGMLHGDIQFFIRSMVGKHLNLLGITPLYTKYDLLGKTK